MTTGQRSIVVLVLLAVLLAASARRVAWAASAEPAVTAVGPIGMTVADAERSIAFYTGVLGFEKTSDVLVWGADYERLADVFGLRMASCACAWARNRSS